MTMSFYLALNFFNKKKNIWKTHFPQLFLKKFLYKVYSFSSSVSISYVYFLYKIKMLQHLV